MVGRRKRPVLLTKVAAIKRKVNINPFLWFSSKFIALKVRKT